MLVSNIEIEIKDNEIKSIIKEAGSMMLQSPSEVQNKTGLANFVTDMDVKIQRFLMEELVIIYPECHFFGKEDTNGNDKNTEGICFFIDPIDGTANYIFGYNHSCVSIGMSIDGVMCAGWVYNPFTNQFWYATQGNGAWLNEKKMR